MIVVETIVRVLAILGAFALGGWGTGLILGRVSDRYYKKHKLPGWASWLARTCGGSLAAFVTYLLVFGGGGAGIGGTGGFFGGSSSPPRPDGGKVSSRDKDNDKDKGKGTGVEDKKQPPIDLGTNIIRIEILGDAPLQQLAGGQSFDRERRYQVAGVSGVQTLGEIKNRLAAMRAAKSGLRLVEIVLYLDSPNRDRPQVAELVGYVRDLDATIKLDFYEPGRRAPGTPP